MRYSMISAIVQSAKWYLVTGTVRQKRSNCGLSVVTATRVPMAGSFPPFSREPEKRTTKEDSTGMTALPVVRRLLRAAMDRGFREVISAVVPP